MATVEPQPGKIFLIVGGTRTPEQVRVIASVMLHAADVAEGLVAPQEDDSRRGL